MAADLLDLIEEAGRGLAASFLLKLLYPHRQGLAIQGHRLRRLNQPCRLSAEGSGSGLDVAPQL